MLVRELMTERVETIRPEDTVGRAAELMVGRDIRHLPVVDHGQIVGLLSEYDLVAFRGYGGTEARVAEAMNTDFECVRPDEDAARAAERMARRKHFCMPVTENGKVVGILTSSDLLLFRARSEASTASDSTGTEERTVATVMTRDPAVARPDDYLLDALGRMAQFGVRHLPVTDGERRVVGILSDRDVRRAVGDLMVSEGEDGLRLRTRTLRVEEVATRAPLTIREGTSITEAARLLVDRRIGALPVVDDSGRLSGILSYVDLLAALAKLDGYAQGGSVESGTRPEVH